MSHVEQGTASESTDPRWSWLYRIGSIVALVTVAFIPLQAIVFIAWPPPATAVDYFALFQRNTFLGLLDLDLLLLIETVMLVPLSLAFYVALRQTSKSWTAIALALGLLGTASYVASNTVFNMLFLSGRFAVATTEAQRVTLLAAGEAMLSTYNGTAFHVAYVLGGIAPLIIALVMLRSRVFGRGTAWMGILANVLAFGLYVPVVGIYLALLSVLPFLAVWYILVARRLWQLGRGVSRSVPA